jgi:hypothetical protein
MRRVLLVVGAIAIVAVSFFTTLFLIDGSAPMRRNWARADHAKLMQDALAAYRKKTGTYPALPDNLLDDLKKPLVDGGFISAIPSDPMRATTGFQYRYVSGGNIYGILFALEPLPWRSGGPCLVGVGTKGSGIFGEPPACPF